MQIDLAARCSGFNRRVRWAPGAGRPRSLQPAGEVSLRRLDLARAPAQASGVDADRLGNPLQRFQPPGKMDARSQATEVAATGRRSLPSETGSGQRTGRRRPESMQIDLAARCSGFNRRVRWAPGAGRPRSLQPAGEVSLRRLDLARAPAQASGVDADRLGSPLQRFQPPDEMHTVVVLRELPWARY